MNTRWNPRNKSEFLKGTEQNVWRNCPDEYLPQLKKEYDKKRFQGYRQASESEGGGPIMQPEHDPGNEEAKMDYPNKRKR